MNFINSYIAEKHVVEEALKERHLIAQGVRPGYIDIILGVRSEGPTPIIFIRCCTYGAH